MTVSVPTDLVRSYAGNGSSVNFSYPIRFDADDELVVVLRSAAGVETVQTLGADYTVAGAGTASGSVTFSTAPAFGVTVVIYRATEETQVVDLEDAARNPAEAVELQMDRTIRMIQDHKALLSRSVMMRAGSAGITFPEPSDGKIIGWNGTTLENKVVTDGAAVLPAVANTVPFRNAANTAYEAKPAGSTGLDLLETATTGEALAVLGIGGDSVVPVDDRAALKALDTSQVEAVYLKEAGREGVFVWRTGDYSTQVAADTLEGIYIKADGVAATVGAWVRQSGTFVAPVSSPALRKIDSKLWDRADLRDWDGVDYGGDNDSASEVQSAINATVGTVLHVPKGEIAVGSKINVPRMASIEGTLKDGQNYSEDASFFLIAHGGVGFECLTAGGARSFKNINTRRIQPASSPGWSPNDHDYDFKVVGAQDIYFENIHLANATRGIYVTGNTNDSIPSGRIYFRNVTGRPFLSGIQLEHVLDCIYMDEVHFWPFVNDQNFNEFVSNNANAFTIGRLDNGKFGRLFAFGYREVMHVQQTAAINGLPTGSAAKLEIQVLGCDKTKLGLVLDPSCVYPTIAIDNLYATGDFSTPSSEPLIDNRGTNSVLRIANLDVEGTALHAVKTDGANAQTFVGDVLANRIGGSVFRTEGSAQTHVNRYIRDKQHSAPAGLHVGSGRFSLNEKNIGQATVASGTSSVVVNHGLPFTPAVENIRLTQLTGLAGAGSAWVGGVTSTQFTIFTNNPPSSNIVFSWEASLHLKPV